MTDDLAEALEWPVRQLAREVANLTRQVAHEQTMRGFVKVRVQRLETSVHYKMSRAGVISWAWVFAKLAKIVWLIVSFGEQGMGLLPATRGIGLN
jgi:hypothetical protein